MLDRLHRLPVALALVSVTALGASAQDQIAGLFRERCASCHLPPDPAFPVDRAWIHQLADTA